VQAKLGSFTAPALVVAGGADLPGTAGLLRSLADGIPDGRFVELPGVPHLQTLERPELIAAALDGFLPRE
jgi:pimeloyl-ACP methyl ester carboxylesterase